MNTKTLSLALCLIALLTSCSDKDKDFNKPIDLVNSSWECKDTVKYIGSPKVIYCTYNISFEGTTFRYDAEETTKVLEKISDTTYAFAGSYTYLHPVISLASDTFTTTSVVSTTGKELIFEADQDYRALRFKRIK